MSRAEIPVENLKPLTDYKDDIKLSRWIINQVNKSMKKRAIKNAVK